MLPSSHMNNKALDRRVKKHILAGEHSIFIPVTPGLEEPVINELEALGLHPEREEEPGSITAPGKMEDLWRCAYLSRCASRLYLRLHQFRAEGFREFRNKTSSFPWELYLKEGAEYRLRFSLRHCRLHVTDNIGKSLERSIRVRFEEQEGRSPLLIENSSPHVDAGIQTILIRGVDDRFTLSLDAGGGPLYDRGYRQYVNEAPLRETLAAALLMAAGLTENSILIDPMCGSGTFTLEAASITAGLPAGKNRRFPFELWPSFRPARYDWIVRKAEEALSEPCKIFASDINADSLKAAEANWKLLSETGLEISQCFNQYDFFKSPCPVKGQERDRALLILNPPYGMRLELKDRLAFFRQIGSKIQRDYKSVRWGIIIPGLDAEKALGLHWEKKYLFKNGGIPVSLLTGRC